jgi:sugar lactone lactonase YvrE
MRVCGIFTVFVILIHPAIAGAQTHPSIQRAATQNLKQLSFPVARAGPAAGKRNPNLQPAAALYGAMPAGAAVSRHGRTFLSFPRWTEAVQFSVGELRLDGTLVAFPNLECHSKHAKPNERLASVQGIFIDARDRLWMLDSSLGVLSAFDLKDDSRVTRIQLSHDVINGAYLNDVCVDAASGADEFAFISDSVRGGVVVTDLHSGQCWRRLGSAPEAHGAADFVGRVEGDDLLYRPAKGKPTPMRGNTDGIAISPDGKSLYFTAFSRREIFAVSADLLRDRNVSDDEVNRSIRKVASKPSANDGITCDPQGRIYCTDYEDNCIRRFDPAKDAEQTGELVVQDERILWPDAVCVRDGWLYITCNQLNRLHEGIDRRREPYVLFRYPLDRH